jgi:hypothetical protein
MPKKFVCPNCGNTDIDSLFFTAELNFINPWGVKPLMYKGKIMNGYEIIEDEENGKPKTLNQLLIDGEIEIKNVYIENCIDCALEEEMNNDCLEDDIYDTDDSTYIWYD